jgi:hypothetical protein
MRLLQNWDDLLQNRATLLQQTWEHAHSVMENLFLHNEHWKDKHMVTVWQYGMVVKGWQNRHNRVVVGAGLVSGRLKGWRRVQGWKIGRWGGRYRWGCYLFRLRKRKDIFMKRTWRET